MGQTRFLVKSVFEERQIFAVRDLKSSGLSIIFKTESGQFGDRMIDKVKDLHISVHTEQYHEDRKCIGFRIKNSILDENDSYYWSSIIVRKRNDKKFVWPVVNVFSSSLFGRNFQFSKKNNDKFVKVIGYRGTGETLVYSIYVTDKSVEMPQVQGFSKITRQFSSFNLVLYVSFFHMPSGNFSINNCISRGAIRKGRNPSVIIGGAQDPAPFNPLSSDDIRVQNYLYNSHEELSKVFMALLKANPHIVPEMLKSEFQSPVFSRWPYDNDEIHRIYGEASDLGKERYTSPFFREGLKKPPGWVEPRGPQYTRPNTEEALKEHGVKRYMNFKL